jgi:lipopolysaccharide biosynthesis glycosyltransferase
MQERHSIVMICDSNFALPASVALTSIKETKKLEIQYEVNIIDCGLSQEDHENLASLASPDFEILFKNPSESLTHLHKLKNKNIASANAAALNKFSIANIFPNHERVLYLDSDIIALRDFSEIFETDLKNLFAAVVADSGQLYYRHDAVKEVFKYFNSGVMLLNLQMLRNENALELLIDAKINRCKGNLVDQNAFNYAFDGRVKYLSIHYNCLCVNLRRASALFSIDELNGLYGTGYSNLDEAISSAAILHFASRDKPWSFVDLPYGEFWWKAFDHSPYEIRRGAPPKVSVVIPIYNLEKYLCDCLESILQQTLGEIEVVCINDGSSDRSQSIIDAYRRRDNRIMSITQTNQGQSAARNLGLSRCSGKYVYFMDGDDLLDTSALAALYDACEQGSLDIGFFDGSAFFEDSELEVLFPVYKDYYKRSLRHAGVLSGVNMLKKMHNSRSYKPSPCLQIFRADYLRENDILFKEGIVYEDNIFSLEAILSANRCQYFDQQYFLRRVRRNSTVTSPKVAHNFKSYIVVSAEVMRNLEVRDLPSEVREICFVIVEGMLLSALKVYLELDEEERKGIRFDLGTMESLLKRIVCAHAKYFTAPRREVGSLSSEVALKLAQDSLNTARSKPFKTMRRYAAHKLLGVLSKCSPPLPSKMAARFKASAAKRDPRRPIR